MGTIVPTLKKTDFKEKVKRPPYLHLTRLIGNPVRNIFYKDKYLYDMAKKIRKILSTGAGDVIEYLNMSSVCEDYPTLCKGGEDTDFVKKSLSGNGFFMLKNVKLRDDTAVSDIGFASFGIHDYAFIFFDDRDSLSVNNIFNYDIRHFVDGLTNNRKFFIKDLRRFLTDTISANDLVSRHSDISTIYRKYPIGDSIIYFDIDFDSLVESEALDEGDPWVIRAVYSDNDYDLEEYEVAKDNWLDGGWLSNYMFKDNAKEKYFELIKRLKPDFNFSGAKDKDWSEINDVIFNYFREDVDEILDEYIRLRNEEVKYATKDAIEQHTKKAFDSYGINVSWDNETVSLKASTLYSLMRMESIYSLGAKDSIEKIISEILNDSNFSGWDESRYEFDDPQYFDREQMDRTSVKYLEKMIEKFDEKKDSYEKFMKIMNEFNFEIDSVARRDLGDNITVIIKGFDSNNDVVRTKVSNPNYFVKNMNIDIDDFRDFLYNPKKYF